MRNEKHIAPLYEALLQYKSSHQRTFHVPGHKNGQAYANSDHRQLLQEVMSIDVTEISGTDDLHHPEGAIREAQLLAADCFGAEDSYWLVGGSTSGNIALLLTVCTEPGDIILVQRNVHKSVLHGLMLAGARAVFLSPQIDNLSGLATAPSVEAVAAALTAYPEAKGVLVTMPNYYGMGFNLAEIADTCHKAGVPLLVDEAHGAHYGLHPEIPDSALSAGADGVVQSTHKMLTAMTMGAMLHVQGPLIDRDLLKQRLSMIQSSSPSYPLMASLDLARQHLHVHGANAFTAGLAAVNKVKRGIDDLPRYGVLQPAEKATAGYTAQDPFKLVIYDKIGSLSGYELQRELEARGCVPEMSDERYVVLLFSLGSSEEDAMHLLDALMHISLEREPRKKGTLSVIDNNHVSTWNILQSAVYSCPIPFSMRKIAKEETESIPIAECGGRRAAEMVIPYPPGIPILYPGELIDEAMQKRLTELRNAGAKCHGTVDSGLNKLLVFKI